MGLTPEAPDLKTATGGRAPDLVLRLDADDLRAAVRMHPQRGANVEGHVLMMPAGRGSSSGSAALAEAIRLETARRNRDEIVGAIVAAELYGATCPVALVNQQDWRQLAEAKVISVNADASGAAVKIDG